MPLPYKTSLNTGVRTLQRTVSTNVWKRSSQRPHIRYVELFISYTIISNNSNLITLLDFKHQSSS